MTEVSDSTLFLFVLLRWLDIVGVVLLVGTASFRETTYLPGLLSVKDKDIRKRMLDGEDGHTNARLRCILYFLSALQFASLSVRVFLVEGGIGLGWDKDAFGIIWGTKLFVIGFLLSLTGSRFTWKGPLLFALSTLLCLMGSLSGHAFASGASDLVLTDWLHFTAVSVWAGGLLPLRDAARRSRYHLETLERAAFLSRLIEVFSIWAIFCVVIIVMTGSFKAMTYLDPVDDSPSVAYGKVLFFKLSIVSIAVGLGGVSRFYILPDLRKIAAHSIAALERLERQLYCVLTVEVVFVALVLIFAALLTQTPPP